MYSSNLKGFILAVVSSAFIGSSFIIKKKGLQRAGAHGPSASETLCFEMIVNNLLFFIFFGDFLVFNLCRCWRVWLFERISLVDWHDY